MNINKMRVDGIDYNIADAKAREMLASDYNTTIQYEENNFCIYEDVLYRALGSTTGEFDSSMWEVSTVSTMLNIESDIELTFAEYEALGEEKLTDGNSYYIIDKGYMMRNGIKYGFENFANNVIYDNAVSGLDAVDTQGAIDEIAKAFQDGCDTLVAGVRAYGVEPISNSPEDIVEAIEEISTKNKDEGIKTGLKSVTLMDTSGHTRENPYIGTGSGVKWSWPNTIGDCKVMMHLDISKSNWDGATDGRVYIDDTLILQETRNYGIYTHGHSFKKGQTIKIRFVDPNTVLTDGTIVLYGFS